MRMIKTVSSLLFVLLLSACGSQEVKEEVPLVDVSADRIATMTDYDELYDLYTQTSTKLAGIPRTKEPAAYASLDQMVDRLAGIKLTDLTNKLNESRLDSGIVPLFLIAEEEAAVSANPFGNDPRWSSVIELLDEERVQTQSAMDSMVTRIANENISDSDRLLLLDDLYRVSGDPQWKQQRSDFVDGLIAEIRAARETGELTSDLKTKLEIVKQERADEPAIVQEMIAVDAEIYQQDFFAALAEGDGDKAYGVLITMAEANDFAAIKSSLASTAQKMVDYFMALANESVQDPVNLPQSFKLYSRSKEVSSLLDLPFKPDDGYKKLISQLAAEHQKKLYAKQPTMALAYLYLIKELSPAEPGLHRKIVESEKTVRQLAVKRLSTTPFRDPTGHGYGDVIAANITQYLFQQIPNDISIIEREQYEAIQRERNLGGVAESLSSVNLIVTGSVLESKVDINEEEGKRLMRVTVGRESVPNPAYMSWLELKPSDRKDVPKPNEIYYVDKQENVSVKITHHRKVGIVSVSYRLVDAETGRILLPDSVSKEQEYTDTSSEGVEMGEFKMPFKLAKLPSDVKILDKLVKEVSEEIGQHLVVELSHQEKHYLTLADKAVQERNCMSEADNLAKAKMIQDAKGIDSRQTYDRFMRTVLECR